MHISRAQVLCAVTVLLSISTSTLWGAGYTFVLPESPWKWVLILFLLVFSIVAAGVVVLLLRFVVGDKTAQLPVAIRDSARKAYAALLREEFRKQMDSLRQQHSSLRQRFSMVMLKVKNLATTLDPQRLFKYVEELITQEVGADRFILFLIDEERQELYPFRWKGVDDKIKEMPPFALTVEHFLTFACKKRQLISRDSALQDPETIGLVDRPPLPTTLLALPICTSEKSFGVIHIESFADQRKEIDQADLRFFSSLASFIGMAWGNAHVYLQTRDELTSTRQVSEKELAEKRKLKEIFSRYTSAELVTSLLKNPDEINLGGVTKEATILFSDIVGFTNFSSKLSPCEIVTSINEYLSMMTEVVLEHQGEIDKFIGDAVMARFGVLADLPTPGLAAVHTALAMLESLKSLQASWAAQGKGTFSIRIGIATGPVLAGNIGSERRMEFTVMGSTVNLASRLESLSKELNTVILIDERTYQQARDEIRAIPRDNIHIRGFDEAIRVYEVAGYLNAPKQGKIIVFQEHLSATRKHAPHAPTSSDSVIPSGSVTLSDSATSLWPDATSILASEPESGSEPGLATVVSATGADGNDDDASQIVS